MYQLFSFKSKYPNHFAFTLECFMLIFVQLFNVDVNYSYIFSFYCSDYLKCIEKNIVNYTYFDSR